MKARLVVVPLLALAATLTACSGDGPSDDPEKTATGFLDELNDGDAAKACEYVATPRVGKPVTKGSEEAEDCEGNVDALLNNATGDTLEDWLASDTKVEIDDDNDEATVAFTDVTASAGVAEVDAEVSLIKADGKWYVVGTTLFPAALASSP
jgi:hypothetical protein